jgi:hypothetical protein
VMEYVDKDVKVIVDGDRKEVLLMVDGASLDP